MTPMIPQLAQTQKPGNAQPSILQIGLTVTILHVVLLLLLLWKGI